MLSRCVSVRREALHLHFTDTCLFMFKGAFSGPGTQEFRAVGGGGGALKPRK